MWNLFAFLTGHRKPAEHTDSEQLSGNAAEKADQADAVKAGDAVETSVSGDAQSEQDAAKTEETVTGSGTVDAGEKYGTSDSGKAEKDGAGSESGDDDEDGAGDESGDDDEDGAGYDDEAPEDAEDGYSEKPVKRRSLYERGCGHGRKRKAPKVGKVPVALNDRITLGEGMAKICVPLAGSTVDEVGEQARAAVASGADVVEWRADYFDSIRNTAAAENALRKIHEILGDIPLLFTYRTSREGGKGRTDGNSYSSVVLWAAGRPEVSIIDIEGLSSQYDAEVLVMKVKELGKPVIASAHFFDRTPKKNELTDIFGCLQRTGADVLKVAAMPEKSRDVLRMMDVSREMDSMLPCPLITISMGDLGRITRVSGSITGSCMTFGTAGAVTAPGQMTVENLRRVMNQMG